MATPVAQRSPVEIKMSFLCALLTCAVAVTLVHSIAGIEIELFARGAATLAGLLIGAPVFPAEGGWLIPILSQPVLVNEACSGTDFYLLTSTLLAWHLSKGFKKLYFCIPLALLSALFLAISINAMRVVCLAQIHHWIIPRVPENYASFIHLLAGIAIFLPALILINLAFEYHDRRQAR